MHQSIADRQQGRLYNIGHNAEIDITQSSIKQFLQISYI